MLAFTFELIHSKVGSNAIDELDLDGQIPLINFPPLPDL